MQTWTFFTATSSTTFTQCTMELEATEVNEITQNKGHYAVQGHSSHRYWYQSNAHVRLPMQWLILTYLLSCTVSDIQPSIDRSKIPIFGYPSCVCPPDGGFPWDDLRKMFRGCQRMATVPTGVQTLPKILTGWVGCTNVTDRGQTDNGGRQREQTWRWVHVR